MATEKIHVKTIINGRPEEFLTDPYVSLLDALRAVSYTHLRAHET